MNTAPKVLVVAEGPSEIGDLDALVAGGLGKKGSRRGEGYIPPMLRKLLGVDVRIDAQKVTALGRHGEKRRLDGHADRAAKALRLAETQGYSLLVFVKDVDKQPGIKKSPAERRRKLRDMHAEIQEGFDDVTNAEHVLRVKATPCRMIEAWALGDAEAIARLAAKHARLSKVPVSPEELWGNEHVPSSNHPKCVLRRTLGKDVNARVFEELAHEADPTILRRTCPDSFGPFADAVEHVAKVFANAPRETTRRSRAR